MGSLTLPATGSVYLDANCFIYSVERVDPYRDMLDHLLDRGSCKAVLALRQLSLRCWKRSSSRIVRATKCSKVSTEPFPLEHPTLR